MDLRKIELDRSLTPKQTLVDLKNRGHLTRLQLRAGARRLDLLTEAGKKDPLKIVLAELQTGKVKVQVKDPEAKENLPRLADVPEGLSTKQKLLHLREAGSLSPQETMVAARAVDQGRKIEQALIAAGAERLLEHVPPPEDEDGQEGQEAEGTEAEGQEAEEAQEEGEAPPAAADASEEDTPEGAPVSEQDPEPRDDQEREGADAPPGGDEEAGSSPGGTRPKTLGELIKLNLDELEPAVARINNKGTLLELVRMETRGKNRVGGIELLVARAEDVGATDDEIQEALKLPEE